MERLQRFSNFMDLKKRPYLEAVGDKYRGVNMPIPSMVISVMRNIPAAAEVNGQVVNRRSLYANTLRWVFTQGLYEASRKRSKLTQLANEKFAAQLRGAKLYDHEMYSKEAHDWWGKRGVDLSTFYKENYEANQDQFEPSKIDLGASGYGNDIKIDIKQINEFLKSEKLPPFHYGGYDGLIEYIETGKDPKTGQVWAKRQTPQSRMDREHDDRIGLDVAGARTERVNGDENSPIIFKFDNFSAPNNERAWGRTVFNILQYGNQQVEKALAGKETDLSDIADKTLYDRIQKDPKVVKKVPYRGIEDTIAGRYEFHTNFENGLKDYASEEFGDPKMFYAVAFFISLGIDEFAQNYNKANRIKNDAGNKKSYPVDFSNDDQLKYVLEKIFKGDLTISPLIRQVTPQAPRDSKRYTRSIIDAGVERAKRMTEEELKDELNNFTDGNSRMTRVAGLNPKNMTGFDKEYIWQDVEKALNHEPSPNIDVYSTEPGNYNYAKSVKNRAQEEIEPLTPETLAAFRQNGYKIKGPVDQDGFPSSQKNASLVNSQKKDRIGLKRVGNQWYVVHRRDQQMVTPSVLDSYRNAGYEMQPYDGLKDENGLPQDRNTFVLFKADDKKDKRYLRKDKEGYWFIINPIENDVPEEELSDIQKGSFRPAVFSGHRMGLNRGSGDRDYYPVGHKDASKIIDKMEADPEAYGLSATDPNNTLDAFYRQVVSLAKKSYENRGGKLGALGNTQELLSYVPGAFLSFAGKNDFRIGDLDNPRLLELLKQVGVEDPIEAQDIIDSVKKYTQEGKNADQIRGILGPEKFSAFAQNGRSWRLKKCVQHVIDRVKEDAANALGGDPDAVPGEEGSGGFGNNEPISWGDFSYKANNDESDDEENLPTFGDITTASDDPIMINAQEESKKRPLFIMRGTAEEQKAFAMSYNATMDSLSPLLQFTSSAGKAAIAKLNSVQVEAEPTPQSRGMVCAIGDFTRKLAIFLKAKGEMGEKVIPFGIDKLFNNLKEYSVNGKYFNPEQIAPVGELVDAGLAKQLELREKNSRGDSRIERLVSQEKYSQDEFEKIYKNLITSANPLENEIANRIWDKVQNIPKYLEIASKYGRQVRPTADAPVLGLGLGSRLGRGSQVRTVSSAPPAPKPTPVPTLKPAPIIQPTPAPVQPAPAPPVQSTRVGDDFNQTPSLSKWREQTRNESMMYTYGSFKLRKLRRTILESNCNIS